MNQLIEEKLRLLPNAPGVYKMFNAAGEVIYVGKAVSLKNRVRPVLPVLEEPHAQGAGDGQPHRRF